MHGFVFSLLKWTEREKTKRLKLKTYSGSIGFFMWNLHALKKRYLRHRNREVHLRLSIYLQHESFELFRDLLYLWLDEHIFRSFQFKICFSFPLRFLSLLLVLLALLGLRMQNNKTCSVVCNILFPCCWLWMPF